MNSNIRVQFKSTDFGMDKMGVSPLMNQFKNHHETPKYNGYEELIVRSRLKNLQGLDL